MITLKLNRFQSVNGEEEEEVRCGQPLRVWRVLGGNWRWFICIGFIDIILIMKAICFWVMCLWDWCDSRRYYMILPAHSSRNLWSRWKWNEWNPACLKRWGSWRLIDWVFSGSWTSRRFVRERRNKGMGIRRNRFCFWCMIREQQHRMMRKWENGYLRIGGNRCSGSNQYRSRFLWMTVEGYLHQSNNKSILSRITEPIRPKFQSLPLNSVNEGRSIHSSLHSISLRIVNVFLYL